MKKIKRYSLTTVFKNVSIATRDNVINESSFVLNYYAGSTRVLHGFYTGQLHGFYTGSTRVLHGSSTRVLHWFYTGSTRVLLYVIIILFCQIYFESIKIVLFYF